MEVELRDKFQAKSARAVLATTTTTTTMTRGTRVGQGSRYKKVLPAANLGPENRKKAKRHEYVQDSRGRWIKFSPPAPVGEQAAMASLVGGRPRRRRRRRRKPKTREGMRTEKEALLQVNHRLKMKIKGLEERLGARDRCKAAMAAVAPVSEAPERVRTVRNTRCEAQVRPDTKQFTQQVGAVLCIIAVMIAGWQAA